MAISGTSDNYLIAQMKKFRQQIQNSNVTISTGGTVSPLANKSSLQVGTYLQQTNSSNRLENFSRVNSAVEFRMRLQEQNLKTIFDLTQSIREKFARGRINDGNVMSGLDQYKTDLREAAYRALSAQDDTSFVYIFGGRGDQVNPMLDIRNTTLFPGIQPGTAFVPNNYSKAVDGAISVYINDSVIIDRPLVNANHPAIAKALEAIMLAATTVNGYDSSAQAAVDAANTAQKLLLDAMYMILVSEFRYT